MINQSMLYITKTLLGNVYKWNVEFTLLISVQKKLIFLNINLNKMFRAGL